MKKRVLSLALALVIMVGIAPTAFAANGYDSLSQYAVGHYREAMALYDLAMTDPGEDINPDNVFLDPHDAWDSYIANRRENNWFRSWSDQHWGIIDETFAREQKPDNWHTESPEWWARIDSYMEIVATEEHIVDTTITWSAFKDWTSAYYPYNTDNFSTEDLAWAEWHDITIDYADWPAVTPFKGISYEDWTTMRNNMSDEEDALFNEWWYGHYIYDGRWNGVRKDDNITFEQYKERESLSENQPTQPSMADENTVEYWKAKTDPAVREEIELQSTSPNMMHILDVCFRATHSTTEANYGANYLTLWKWASGLTKDEFDTLVWGKPTTPEPTPTTTPAPVETQPVQHFADVAPDAWYYEAVNNMAEAGILKGKGDGLFHPNDNITKGEVATIICRIGQNGSERYAAIGDPNNNWYSERVINNPAHWAERAIFGARASTDTTPTPTFWVTVESADEICPRWKVFDAMCRLAYEDQFSQYWHPELLWEGESYYRRVLNVTDEDLEKARQEIRDLDDDCYGAVRCWALGIIHGDGNGYVHPQAGITRAELCQILYNMGAKTCYLDL